MFRKESAASGGSAGLTIYNQSTEGLFRIDFAARSHPSLTMTANEERLLELLKKRSFKRALPGEMFTLASGEKSEYFIDGKMTAVCSEGAALIGEVLYDRTKDDRIDAIGGLQVGAVPLATAAVISYHQHGRPIEGFWAREESKDHGTRKRVEGGLQKGMRVAVIDDVFTKGGSTLKAVEAVRDFGCEVVFVLALVDRLRGAQELFRQNGITDYRTVFTIRDFGITVPADAAH
ncbi:MAG: orotate phosphoribosyltransferase [Planctomycetaceae bacterium]|nr:orotate phosphoribosyltransferase [Planctomycetaceae bacterium]